MYYMYEQVRDGILILFIVTKLFFGCRGRDLQCRQVKFTQVKSRVILVQVKSSQVKSHKNWWLESDLSQQLTLS